MRRRRSSRRLSHRLVGEEEPLLAVLPTLRSPSRGFREELLSVLAATSVMLFELLLGDGQDIIVRQVAKLPHLVEVLKDGLDRPSGLGVVGPYLSPNKDQ
jgi:hypothetical protein